MKTKIYSLFAILTLSLTAWSQGVGINETGNNPNPSAILDVESTDKGFLPPRMTTVQRDAISNPATGLMVYNISLFCLQVNDGTPASPIWNCISNGAGIPDGTITTIDCAGATNNGTLTAGQAASGVNSEIDYTGGNGGAHGGQEVTSTGVVGLTANLVAGTFGHGNGTLTYNITGTPESAGTASFEINIGGQSCTLTVTVETPSFPNICNPSNPTAIVDVTNPVTGRTWMDRNLGANRAATSLTDTESYGHLYQWGRGSDGHQCVNRFPGDGVTTAVSTTTLSSSETPVHGDFIIAGVNPQDWLNTQNPDLWQGVNGINNPCPSGYRVPSQIELNEERLSWVESPINSTNDQNGAFASPLKLPLAGRRDNNTADISVSGTFGQYWTSTTVFASGANRSQRLSFGSTFASFSAVGRAVGNSVRCIKN